MSFFTSDRERRLWLWTLAVLVAIYSTLGLARMVADTLRKRDLLEVSLALVVIVVVGAIAAARGGECSADGSGCVLPTVIIDVGGSHARPY